MEVSISYRTDLAKKNVDFLKNPKGFHTANFFSNKIIIGRNIKNEKEKTEFIRQFQILNPRFPITNIKLSNISNKPTSNTITNVDDLILKEQPSVSNQPIKQTVPIVLKPKEEEERPSIFSSPIVLIGLAGLAYYLFKGKK